MHLRDQPGIGAKAPGIREAAHVPDLTEDEQGGVRANAGHGAQELGLRVLLYLGFDGGGDRCDLGRERLQEPQVAIQSKGVAKGSTLLLTNSRLAPMFDLFPQKRKAPIGPLWPAQCLHAFESPCFPSNSLRPPIPLWPKNTQS